MTRKWRRFDDLRRQRAARKPSSSGKPFARLPVRRALLASSAVSGKARALVVRRLDGTPPSCTRSGCQSRGRIDWLVLLLDAGALYAQADRADPHHFAVAELLQAEHGPLIASALAIAEADYLILTRLGVDVELAFLDDLAEGTFQVECLTRSELRTAAAVARQYRDLEIGLADASLVVLAQRFHTRRLVTFDNRAFRPVLPLQGGTFELLPSDR
jgi:uncharacterized protein